MKSFVNSHERKNHTPHIFALASNAYHVLCVKQKPQTILISGESGAGKTETTKFAMKCLSACGAVDPRTPSSVEQQVLETNPVLEAFGNARTLRNDNSSRFGKFISMQFNPEGAAKDPNCLCGARMDTYLLEAIRVSNQQEGERNYHIFYQLCAAGVAGKKNVSKCR